MVRVLEEVAVAVTETQTFQSKPLPELGAALLSAAMALPCVVGVAHAESAPEKAPSVSNTLTTKNDNN